MMLCYILGTLPYSSPPTLTHAHTHTHTLGPTALVPDVRNEPATGTTPCWRHCYTGELLRI